MAWFQVTVFGIALVRQEEAALRLFVQGIVLPLRRFSYLLVIEQPPLISLT